MEQRRTSSTFSNALRNWRDPWTSPFSRSLLKYFRAFVAPVTKDDDDDDDDDGGRGLTASPPLLALFALVLDGPREDDERILVVDE